MIKLKNLSCNYEKQNIIQNLSLELPSHLCIIGSNGSGKSTLAKALCNMIDFEGEIYLEGKELREYSHKKRSKIIHYIPAKLESFDAYSTVYEFVALSRYAHHRLFASLSKDEKKLITDTLDFLNITHLQTKQLSNLSSGEQQLTLIAAALVQESKIIIFDEPTANLDPQNCVHFFKQLTLLQQTHQCILITHDLALASHFEGSLLYMSKNEQHFFKKSSDFFTEQTLEQFYHGSITKHPHIGVHYA